MSHHFKIKSIRYNAKTSLVLSINKFCDTKTILSQSTLKNSPRWSFTMIGTIQNEIRE